VRRTATPTGSEHTRQEHGRREANGPIPGWCATEAGEGVDTPAPIASGQAQYVDAVPSIPGYAFPAMKSNAICRDKEALVTALGIRFGKLSEVMKAY
jgi:hypothetical protein